MEGSATMRTALLVLLVAAFVCIEGRNMPAGQGADQPQTFGGLDGGMGLGGMGGMPGMGNGVPGLGMMNPPALGFGFVNPPGFGVVGGWPTMLSPPGLGHAGGGIGGPNPPGIGHGIGGWGFSMVNPPVVGEPFTFPGFGGVPSDMVGTVPHPTGEGKGSP